MTGSLPILTFHAIDDSPLLLSFPPQRFANLMRRLRDAGWQCLGLEAVVACIRSARPLPAKSFVLTFDDGYQSVYTAALPVLRELNLTATVFVATGEQPFAQDRLAPLEGRTRLSWDELRQLKEAGITIGAHTVLHAELPQLSEAAMDRELRGSKAALEDGLGGAVTTFAYPKGRYDVRSRALAARYFKCACTDQFGYVGARSDPYTLERIESYYLQSEFESDLILGRWSGLYVPVRRLLRAVRRALAGLPAESRVA